MATKKILTDLDIDGVVDIATTNTDNDSTNGIDIDMTKNSTGTGYATSIKGVNAEVDNSGSAQVNTISGIRTVAKHSGTGDGYFLSGVLSTTTNEGSGDVSGFYGTYTTLNSNGTGVQDVDYMIGNTIAMNFNNANLDVNRVGAINAQLNFNAATTINTEAYVCLLDTDFTGVTGTDVTVDGDFSYLYIKSHTTANVPDVTGTARAINSESTLPSRFAGDMHFEGNVGIGTDAPSQELHVNGNIRVGSNTDAFYGNRFTGLGNADVELRSKDGYDLLLNANTGDNVGIGTASPNAPLSVHNTTSTLGARVASFYHNNGTENPFIEINSLSDGMQLKAGFTTGIAGHLDILTGGGSSFITLSTNNNEVLRATASGNVGIGTTSPSEKLEVNGNIRLSDESELYIQGSTASRKIVRLDNTLDKGLISLNRNDETNVIISSDVVTRGHTYFNGLNVNVGIGTTSPSYKLTVDSGAIDQIARFTSTDVNSKISLEDDTSISYWNLSAGTTSIGSNNTVNSSNLNIDSSGNVGIGTTSPSEKLEVADTNQPPVIRLNRDKNLSGTNWVGESFGDIEFYTSDTSGANVYAKISAVGGLDSGVPNSGVPDGDLVFYNRDHGSTLDESMRINSLGNVGIGTTSPSTPLDVRGDITIRNANGGNPVDAGSLYFTEAGNTWGTDIYGFRINQEGSANYLQFQSSVAATVIDILTLARNTGNVGIGTTSPSEKLEVVGDAKMTGKLNVGTTTDYADNAAALLAGLVVGDIYRTGDTLKIVH